ncbi:MAG: hypothetical protein R2755_21295 [Acidimicrobiales bacterium]
MTLAATGEGLSFEVRDNGPGVADAAVAAAGHGLRNMADRLAAVGAELRLDSPPGGGLALRALVPHLPVHDQPALDRGPVMGVVPAPPP